MALLTAQNVCKSYGDASILNNINMTIAAGQTIAIQGKSGCGKTTLLNILSGLDQPCQGKVIWNQAQDLATLSNNQRATLYAKHFGYIFQFHYLLNNLTVLENLTLPLYNIGYSTTKAIDEAKSLLASCDMGDYAQFLPNILSGGQRQRIAILRGIIHKPRIIFADEPTGNLDPDNSKQCVNLLQQYCDDHNGAMIMVTHNNDIAQKMDKITEI